MDKQNKIITIVVSILIVSAISIMIIIDDPEGDERVRKQNEYEEQLEIQRINERTDSVTKQLKIMSDEEDKRNRQDKFEKDKFKTTEQIQEELYQKNLKYYNEKEKQQRYMDSVYGK